VTAVPFNPATRVTPRASVRTARYDRELDLAKFAPDHRPVIRRTVDRMEALSIIATPLGYLHGHRYVLLREHYDRRLTPMMEADPWFSVLTLATGATATGSTWYDALRRARHATNRRLAFRRTLILYLSLGVSREDAATVVGSLRRGTDVDELAAALEQYVPAEARR
jgi:hypothetical protein